MNTGKIMIGFSLVLLSIAMMVSPSAAAGVQDRCEAGCGIAVPMEEAEDLAGMHPGLKVAFIANEPRTDATTLYER